MPSFFLIQFVFFFHRFVFEVKLIFVVR